MPNSEEERLKETKLNSKQKGLILVAIFILLPLLHVGYFQMKGYMEHGAGNDAILAGLTPADERAELAGRVSKLLKNEGEDSPQILFPILIVLDLLLIGGTAFGVVLLADPKQQA